MMSGMSNTTEEPKTKLKLHTPDTDPPGPPVTPSASSDMSADSDVSAASIVEAILFATDTPLPAPKIADVAGDGNARDVKKHIAALNETYAERGAAFRIEEIAGGFQMLTLPVYNDRLSRLLQARRETRLSQAALETLAIVAYKQPILRADVEAIRGVAVGEVLNRLRELNLVKIVGRAEEIGRPLLYGTTKKFLDVFGLGSLDDLPKDQELAQPDS